MIQVGILSDTHIQSISESFRRNCARAFDGCDIIVHAGDLTRAEILDVFRGKEVHAVHGNMCDEITSHALPTMAAFIIAGYSFGLTHGTGTRHNIEDRVFDLFPEADCIIFGHTHQPLIRKIDSTLLINPGSFQTTGRYGAPATYCLITIEKGQLKAKIHELQI